MIRRDEHGSIILSVDLHVMNHMQRKDFVDLNAGIEAVRNLIPERPVTNAWLVLQVAVEQIELTEQQTRGLAIFADLPESSKMGTEEYAGPNTSEMAAA